MKSKKVIFLSTWDNTCSIAHHSRQMITQLQRLGYECDVFPIKVDSIKGASTQNIKIYFDMFIDKIQDYDIVNIEHEHSFFSGSNGIDMSYKIFGYILSRINKPCLVSFHSNPIIFYWQRYNRKKPTRYDFRLMRYSYLWFREVAKRINRKSGLILVKAHTAFHCKMLRASGINSKYIKMAYVGIDQSAEIKNTGMREQIKKQSGFSEKFVIGIFGFVVMSKGYKFAIDALKLLPEDCHILIMGGRSLYQPEYYDEIVNYIEKNSEFKNKVTITGYLDNEKIELYMALCSMAVACYEDDFQASSAAVMRCLNSGIPVIASDIYVFKEMKKQANCLEIYKKNSIKDFVKKVKFFYYNQHYRKSLAGRGRSFTRMRTWENYTIETAKFYDELLSKGGE